MPKPNASRFLFPLAVIILCLPAASHAHFIALEWIKEHVVNMHNSRSVAWNFTRLGIEHILIGYDHILFLIAMIIYGTRFRGNLKTITAFTVAHSITLALAALNLVNLPSRLVESFIAASIVYVAIENIFVKVQTDRWKIAFLFGLIHGFGFASVLREIGLPTHKFWVALVTFNLGVEIGQVIIVAAVFLIVSRLYSHEFYPKAATACTAVIAALGSFWFISRAFNLGLG